MSRKKATSEVRKGKDWRPNAKQMKMAELLVNPDDRRTKQEKCKEVGITAKTLWKWMKDERFVNYYNQQIDKYKNAELAEVWKALIRSCKKENVQAIKLFFEMTELHPSVKKDAW